jgi:hypothetical protein
MKNLTEKMLLDGYEGLTNGLTKISNVKGHEIYWTWRITDHYGDPECVCEPEDREIITLEFDRYGTVEIDHENDNHPSIQLIKNEEACIYGNIID